MKLYLHVGTEKTGSSYLQFLIYINRAILRKKYGIYVPANKMQDKRMRKGMISGGNGILLKEYLQNNNEKKLCRYLDSIIKQAKSAECESIILSNENIFEQLTNENVNLLCNLLSVKRLEPHFLLVLREPVSHIISLYKHRNKYGKYSSIDEWLRDGYHTHKHVDNFVESVNKCSLYRELKIINYENREGDGLIKSFIQDWLNANISDLNIEDRPVNISLTLTELKLINILSNRSDVIGNHLNEELSKIGITDKSSVSPVIENTTKLAVYKYLLDNYNDFSAYMSLYFEGEGCQLKKYRNERKLIAGKLANDSCQEFSISDQQLKAVAKVIINVSGPYLQIKRISKLIASMLPQKLTNIYKYYRL